ncbi:amino acid ABC transporter permease [Achromobacter sp. DH1f]|uniref:amino acid ABC transporter permease n=1 Tax=Achromobacter sp. DH1f TaxID=1397275 RepID=UPI00046AC31D|nr:amino acid ABC transporter permease [Achromobacter sp. DH1f]
MNYQWSWSVFLELSPDGVHTYLQTLLMGAGWTIVLALCASICSVLFGSLLAILRTASSRSLNRMAMLYVEVFRNIPLLVQMFLWFFVVPELLPIALGDSLKQMPQPWGAFLPAWLCLAFYGSARMAEQIRAGIQSLPAGQARAGAALGLNEGQVYRYVILPQAFRIVIPPLTSELIGTVKYSSVALTIGLLELTGQARSMQEYSFHIFEAFSAATLGYLAINGLIVLSMRTIERRVAVPGLLGVAGAKAH